MKYCCSSSYKTSLHQSCIRMRVTAALLCRKIEQKMHYFYQLHWDVVFFKYVARR